MTTTNTTKETIIKGTAWNLFGTLMVLIVGIGSSILYVRYLGPTLYGTAIYLTDLSIFLVGISTLGLGSYQATILPKLRISNKLGEYKYVVLKIISIRIILSILCVIILFFAWKIKLLETSQINTAGLIVFIGIFCVLQVVLACLRGNLNIEYEQKYLNIVDTFSVSFRLILVLIIIFIGGRLYSFLLTEVIVEILQIIFLSARFYKTTWFRVRDSISVKYPNVIRSSLPMFVVDTLSRFLGKEFDVFMIGILMQDPMKQVAAYSLCYVLVLRVFSFLGLGTANTANLIMNFSADLVSSGHMSKVATLVEKQIKLVIFFVAPIMVGGAYLGSDILLLMYGKELSKYVSINAILFIGFGISSLTYVSKPVLFVMGKDKQMVVVRTILTVAKVGLIYLFSSSFGLHGVAFASVCVLGGNALLELIILKRVLSYKIPYKLLFKVTLANLSMLGTLCLCRGYIEHDSVYSILTSVLVGVVTYVIILFIFKPIEESDYEVVANMSLIKKTGLVKIFKYLKA
jgi:O-antigen/teichoic acid export membrane protein